MRKKGHVARMISLAFGRGSMCMATIVFFTCVWIPLRQLKAFIGSLIGILSSRMYQPFTVESTPCEVKLPICRLQELQRTGGAEEEEICSVCLAEFTGEDLVSQVHRCGHIFHFECIENWLHRDHFTCPLCRSFLFSAM